jgi:hypothetical protein
VPSHPVPTKTPTKSEDRQVTHPFANCPSATCIHKATDDPADCQTAHRPSPSSANARRRPTLALVGYGRPALRRDLRHTRGPVVPTGSEVGSTATRADRARSWHRQEGRAAGFGSLLPLPSYTYNSPVLLVTSMRPSGVKSGAVGRCESVTLVSEKLPGKVSAGYMCKQTAIRAAGRTMAATADKRASISNLPSRHRGSAHRTGGRNVRHYRAHGSVCLTQLCNYTRTCREEVLAQARGASLKRDTWLERTTRGLGRKRSFTPARSRASADP